MRLSIVVGAVAAASFAATFALAPYADEDFSARFRFERISVTPASEPVVAKQVVKRCGPFAMLAAALAGNKCQ
jgi:hypothetical protein